MAYESIALPRLPDGRSYISDQMIAQDPSLAGFVRRGSNFWAYDHARQAWVSPYPESATP